MPHLPGHNKPFTSFLTQGMQNTNQNINRINTPWDTNPIGGSTNYLSPRNPNTINLPGFSNQTATGQGMDNWFAKKGAFGAQSVAPKKPLMPTDRLPEGWDWQMVGGNWEPVNPNDTGQGPGTIPGNVINPPNYLQETPPPSVPGISPETMLDKMGTMESGFDVNNDGVVNVQDAAMTGGMSPADWAQSTGTGGFSFEDYQDLMYQSGMDAGNWVGWQGNPMYDSSSDWWSSLDENTQSFMTSQFENMGSAETVGFGGSDMGWASWNVENPAYGWEQSGFGDGGMGGYYDQEYSAESQQGFLDNLMNYINPQQSAPQQFTGGGGQAGQQARDLYYPGTSGGFAGVGSGIGGGGMQSMLKNLMG